MSRSTGYLYYLMLTAAALCLCTKLPPNDLQIIDFGNNNGVPPSAPVISSVVPGNGSLTVYWDTVAGATSYDLYYQAGATVDMTSGTKLQGVTSPKQVTGLINGTPYAFAVSGVNAAGVSGLSAVRNGVPVAGGAVPSAPSITSVTPGNGTVTVYWDTVTGATSYNLYYEAGTTVDKASGTLRVSVASGYPVAALTNGTTYAFAVSAVNGAGESALSAVLTVTPGGTVAGVMHVVQFGGALGFVYSPSSFSATVGDTVKWEGDFSMHPISSTSVPSGALTWHNESGSSFIYLIKVAGAYSYHCDVHFSIGMVGTFTATN